jgi:hypothetical protein
MIPFTRIPLPDYPWEHEPDDAELGWEDDVPVDIYGNTEEEPE